MAEDSSEIVKEQSESVAATNLKVLGDMPAYYTGLQYAQALDAAAGWRALGQTIVAKAAENIMATSPAEGAADSAVTQVLAKMAQTTPATTA
jgi:hypothetical protein